MKKYIIILISGFFLASCNYKEDDIFEQKPSERIDPVLEAYKKTLENHDGYWLLSYYPRERRDAFWVYPYEGEGKLFANSRDFPKTNQSLGGYNFFLKFKDGKVTTSSEIGANNHEEDTYFDYILTEEPTLSFNTFGDIFHHFVHVTGIFPSGRGGEIDFNILKQEGDVLTLRGRTLYNEMTLTKFSGDRQEYLNTIRENANALKNKGLSSISVGGTAVKLKLFPSYRQLTFLYENDTKYEQRAFIVTDKGIKLYEPVTINNVTFDEFYFNDTKTALTTTDGSISTSFVTSPLVIEGTKTITFATGKVSASRLRVFQSTQRRVGRSNNGWFYLDNHLDFQTMQGNDFPNVTGIHMKAYYAVGDYAYEAFLDIFYEMDFVPVPDAPNQVDILIKDPLDKNNYIQYFKGTLDTFITNIPKAGPFIVETQSDGSVKLTSSSDSNYWFILE